MNIKKIIVGELETNCYLAGSAGELIIIDPGDEAEKIATEIVRFGATPRSIILTHHHFDHIGAAWDIAERLKVPILIHEKEKKYIDFPEVNYLKEGDEIKVGDEVLQVINMPGHTLGGLCLLGEKIIFTGDTLFKDGYGRTDLPEGSSDDMNKSLERLKKLIKPGTIVFPGHGESFLVR